MKSMIMELNYYRKRLDQVNKELQELPSGRLIKKGNFYAHAINGREIGITSDTELIIRLYRKKYLLKLKRDLIYDINAISRCLNRLKVTTPQEIICTLSPVYQGQPESNFHHPSVKDWIAEPYQKNTFPLKGQTYTSKKGIEFRSKTEYMIASELDSYDIPYRYDAAITLDGQTKYSDFIIKCPYNGIEIIWEHFGGLDYSGYIEKMNEKMSLYIKEGYIPFETLIYTFESDVRDIRNLQGLIEDIILKP